MNQDKKKFEDTTKRTDTTVSTSKTNDRGQTIVESTCNGESTTTTTRDESTIHLNLKFKTLAILGTILSIIVFTATVISNELQSNWKVNAALAASEESKRISLEMDKKVDRNGERISMLEQSKAETDRWRKSVDDGLVRMENKIDDIGREQRDFYKHLKNNSK